MQRDALAKLRMHADKRYISVIIIIIKLSIIVLEYYA